MDRAGIARCNAPLRNAALGSLFLWALLWAFIEVKNYEGGTLHDIQKIIKLFLNNIFEILQGLGWRYTRPF